MVRAIHKNVCFNVNSEVKLALDPKRMWCTRFSFTRAVIALARANCRPSGRLFVTVEMVIGSIKKIHEVYGKAISLVCRSKLAVYLDDTSSYRYSREMIKLRLCTHHIRNIRKVWLSFFCISSHQQNLLLHFPSSFYQSTNEGVMFSLTLKMEGLGMPTVLL